MLMLKSKQDNAFAILLFLLVSIFLVCCGESDKTKSQIILKEPKISDTLNIKNTSSHLVIVGFINDTIKTKFVFDTGCIYSLVFDESFAAKNGLLDIDSTLTDLREKRIQRNTEVNKLQKRAVSFKVGNLIDTGKFNAVMDLQRIIGNRAQVIIGLDFMQKYLIEIDYLKSMIVLHQFDRFKKRELFDTVRLNRDGKTGPSFFKIPVTFNPGQGLASFTEQCLLDLGSGGSKVPISTRLVKKYNLLRLKPLEPFAIKQTTMTGEKIKGFYTRFQSLKFGNFNVDTPRIELSTSETGISAGSVPLFGNYILSKYGRVFLDFKNAAIYIPKK